VRDGGKINDPTTFSWPRWPWRLCYKNLYHGQDAHATSVTFIYVNILMHEGGDAEAGEGNEEKLARENKLAKKCRFCLQKEI
jgi:hypothetical protein